jgi:adenine-specific DNA-methyltransferase
MFITDPVTEAGEQLNGRGDGRRSIVYDPRRHSAVRTEDYVFAQLIPYLGNKRKLLPLIAEAVELTGVRDGVFADLFAGSGVVSRWAKQHGFQVVANDWEPYSELINACHIGLNTAPKIGACLLDELNDRDLAVDGYFTEHYCPADDANPQPKRERCFYTRFNGRRIDAIREQIAEWEESGKIDAAVKSYLMAPLLYGTSYVSNTSGVFKAYHHGWGGQTGTALYRILSEIRLTEPILIDNGRENVVTRADALDVAGNWDSIMRPSMDIAYLDPPYNQHPYGSNYHILNTVALWDKPPVGPMRHGSKSAIRTDWRTERRSAYNHASTALPELLRLVDALPSRWVLLSYSTEGNIPVEALLEELAARGETELVTKRYKRYRVSSQRMSPKPHTIEFVAVLDKAARPHPSKAIKHARTLADAEIA